MDITFNDEKEKDAFLKNMFFLAYEACGGTTGMGFMQSNPDATADEVFENICNHGDYSGIGADIDDSRLSADYVFGRMMKLSVEISDKTVTLPDMKPEVCRQGWAMKYKSYKSLAKAAMALSKTSPKSPIDR